jgi:hypothetical protein
MINPSGGNYLRRRRLHYVMAPTDRLLLEALADSWRAIQRRPLTIKDEDSRIATVPNVSFSLQPHAASNCNSVEWDSPLPAIILNLIDPEKARGRKPVKDQDGEITGYKLSGQEVVAWLAHLAAHGVKPRPANETGRSPGAFTTSAGMEGMFHTRLYAEAAEDLGLDVGPQGSRGWSETSLRRGEYADEVAELQAALDQWKPIVMRKYDRGPFSAVCACGTVNDLPQKLFRASIGVMRNMGISVGGEEVKAPVIFCEDCQTHFTYRPTPERRKSSRTSATSAELGRWRDREQSSARAH